MRQLSMQILQQYSESIIILFKGFTKQYNIKMKKLKSVQIQYWILNPEIHERCICRGLKNHTYVDSKATWNVKTLFIMNSNDLCKISTAF